MSRLVNIIKREPDNILTSENITPELIKHLTPRNPIMSQIHGLLKIHSVILLRPIVSIIGSATYNLAKELSRILSLKIGRTESFVKNLLHYVDIVNNISLEDQDVLVSFDVKRLFTQVQVDDAHTIIRGRLNLDQQLGDRTTMNPTQICHLIELCLCDSQIR